jgi:hypothetical protein
MSCGGADAARYTQQMNEHTHVFVRNGGVVSPTSPCGRPEPMAAQLCDADYSSAGWPGRPYPRWKLILYPAPNVLCRLWLVFHERAGLSVSYSEEGLPFPWVIAQVS